MYWAYRLVGTTSVAAFGSLAVFGVYAFAVAPVTMVVRALAPIQAVLTPMLWGEMGATAEATGAWEKDARRLTVALAAVAGVATGLAQAIFKPIVLIAVPKFADSVAIFEVLSITIFLLIVILVPSLILTSAQVNRQALVLWIWLAGLVVNAVANVLAFSVGPGVMAVAWNDVWVQFVVVVFIFEAAAPHFVRGRVRFKLHTLLLGMFGLVLAVTFVVGSLPAPSNPNVVSVLIELAVRSGLVLVIWAVAISAWWLLSRRRSDPKSR